MNNNSAQEAKDPLDVYAAAIFLERDRCVSICKKLAEVAFDACNKFYAKGNTEAADCWWNRGRSAEECANMILDTNLESINERRVKP